MGAGHAFRLWVLNNNGEQLVGIHGEHRFMWGVQHRIVSEMAGEQLRHSFVAARTVEPSNISQQKERALAFSLLQRIPHSQATSFDHLGSKVRVETHIL